MLSAIVAALAVVVRLTWISKWSEAAPALLPLRRSHSRRSDRLTSRKPPLRLRPSANGTEAVPCLLSLDRRLLPHLKHQRAGTRDDSASPVAVRGR